MQFKQTLTKILTNPKASLELAFQLFWGHYYRVKFKLLGQKVIIGKRFRVSGPLIIKGPGTVIFGDDCIVTSSKYWPTTPYTHRPEAVIRIGDRVGLSSVRMGCSKLIDIKRDCTIGECRIVDSDFHSIEICDMPHYKTEGAVDPIVIGPRAWICIDALVMRGSEIGENSVISAGAVINQKVPSNSIMSGNPARRIGKLQ